ncbi:MarR family transcriptional regulator [Prescottella equi]|uniref:MarR family transcriptional regulator n=1 Tax=Rhodococcus hoagii TaxID=43767 RepID=A0A9Q5A1X0_RHOHA|nr:MarR family transcriptional regulator [Prescottella equi]MBM4481204.1 MarR family transcriptional regulator [Prescottella equi]MBM4488776.1 MarR family transcriptional regulator [Prescottella equi]MBM4498858.1 MarR family transcriptional regulator [Prescottella equi]MBM4503820.1 MarR family transcriptional regulator [Prescottella equi]MBM4507955.1 MarR family transcriptional regulator [Prescottella equi]
MSRDEPRADLLMLLMRGSSALAEQINAAVVAAGHPSLRPAHGLLFLRVAGDGATVSEIAAYLGITKQSAAVMVDELVASGYVSKHPHRSDRRSQLVRLTSAGVDVTAAATDAALRCWEAASTTLGADTMASLVVALEEIGKHGTPRPVW